MRSISIVWVFATACASAAAVDPPARTIAVKKHDPLITSSTTSTTCDPARLVREEQRIESSPGVEVFIMRIGAPERRGAVVLTHGAGSAGSALWDLEPKGYSVMRNLACAGFDAYSVDVRGFGGSSMPEALSQPAELAPPAVRAADVMPDVDAAVSFAKRRSSVDRVDLIGWSWGSLVAGMYAGLHPESMRRLVLFAPLYDRKWPERHQTSKAWYVVKRETFFQYFDPKKEERAVLEDFVESLFRFENGLELRLPNGPYADLYGPASPIWDARKVTAPVLVVRGDRDQASLDVHAQKLFADLSSSPVRRYVVIGGADHFAFRTKKHGELESVIAAFLSEDL